MKHEKDNDKPRIHGNALSVILQRAYYNEGELGVFKVAKECVSGLTADQLIAIAKNEAYLDGDTINGLVYKTK